MAKSFEIEGDDGEEVTITVPTVKEVCGTCRGEGKHVHHGVDGNGITESEFAEDAGFAEEYFSGMYDVTCTECHGLRVVDAIDWDGVSEADTKALNAHFEAEYYYAREAAAERAMGA